MTLNGDLKNGKCRDSCYIQMQKGVKGRAARPNPAEKLAASISADLANPKILVTGSTGRLGPYIIQALGESDLRQCQVFTLSRERIPDRRHTPLDITSLHELLVYLEKLRPNVILHLAANSSPFDVEADHGAARKVNYDSVKLISTYAAETGSYMIFTSSDFVFRGDFGYLYTEAHSPDPETYYGHLKARAEESVLGARGLVVRLSLLFPILELADELNRFFRNGSLEAADDEFRTPVHPTDAARAIVRLCLTGARGLFHVGGPENVTPMDVIARIVELQRLDWPIRKISRKHLLPRGRPQNVGLDSSRLRQAHPDLEFRKVVPHVSEV